jgi:hypothetical protein
MTRCVSNSFFIHSLEEDAVRLRSVDFFGPLPILFEYQGLENNAVAFLKQLSLLELHCLISLEK